MPGAVAAAGEVAPVVSGVEGVEAVAPLKEVLLLVLGSVWAGYWLAVLLEVEPGVEVGVVLLALSEPDALVEE